MVIVVEMDTATRVQNLDALIEFHMALISLGKVWIQLYSSSYG